MTTNYLPFLILWGLMAASVLVLIVWRKTVQRGEDDSLHVLEPASVAAHQSEVAHKLEQIDKWGKMLTVLTVLFGAAIAGFYLYQMWVATSTTIQG